MKILVQFILLGIFCALNASANMNGFEGVATYYKSGRGWPPVVSIDGEAATRLKEDFGFSKLQKEVLVKVDCLEVPNIPTYCSIQFPSE